MSAMATPLDRTTIHPMIKKHEMNVSRAMSNGGRGVSNGADSVPAPFSGGSGGGEYGDTMLFTLHRHAGCRADPYTGLRSGTRVEEESLDRCGGNGSAGGGQRSAWTL
jgi:hypothetical protein